MPTRKIVFANNQFYHVFNRTVGDETIFIRQKDIKRALALINFYRFKTIISFSKFITLNLQIKEIRQSEIFSSPPLVEICAFSLMPNHFHFLIRQLQDNGITTFLSNFQNSFAKFYNTKSERHGTLFCNMFKAVFIETEEQCIHVSRYIHLNHISAFMMKLDELDTYQNTSFATYMGNIKYDFISTEFLLSHFKSAERYREFVYNQVEYQRKLKLISQFMLD